MIFIIAYNIEDHNHHDGQADVQHAQAGLWGVRLSLKHFFGSVRTKHNRDKVGSQNSVDHAHAVKTIYFGIPKDEWLANKTSPYNSFMTAYFEDLQKTEQKTERDTAN